MADRIADSINYWIRRESNLLNLLESRVSPA